MGRWTASNGPKGAEPLPFDDAAAGSQIEKVINDDLIGASDSRQFTYDGWNRLVGTDIGPEGGQRRWRTRYWYNTMHQRVTRTVYTDESTESDPFGGGRIWA